jgi:hypothetical protein
MMASGPDIPKTLFFFGTKGNITLDHTYICLSFRIILVSIVSQDQIS